MPLFIVPDAWLVFQFPVVTEHLLKKPVLL